MLLGVASPAQAYSGVGDGSATYPYRITTCAQFFEIANNTAANYVLMNDVDCTGVTYASIVGFSGSFDGRNHTLSNLTASVPAPGGLFVSTNSATIKNLNITNENITTSGGANTGGLIGQMNGGLTENVTVSGTITGGNSAGGVVGVESGGTITASSFTGSLSVDDGWGGGLVGVVINGSIDNSYANATLTGTDGGGLVGTIITSGTGTVNVTDSYALGNVNFGGGNNNRGGLVERVDQFPTGTVNLTNNFVVASLHGGSAIYAWSDGGTSAPTVSNNFFDATVAGSSTSCVGGSPASGCAAVNTDGTDGSHFKNTASAAPLGGWDFTNTWQQTSGYPTLRAASLDTLATPTVPGTATNLQAAAMTPKSSVSLTWGAAPDGGSDVTYYAKYRDVTAGDVSFTTFGTSTTATNLVVTGLALNHQYQIEILAHNALGDGGTTTPITYTTTSDNSSVITTCAQLQAIDDNLSGSYTLGSDINCYGSDSWNSGAGFSPIGAAVGYGTVFTGSFNGNGHTIFGLTTDQSSDFQNAGLFWELSGATVQNLYLTGVSVTGYNVAGALAATAADSNITNVGVEDSSVTDTSTFAFQAGGLVGNYFGNTGDPTLSQSYFSGSVTGAYNVGGLVGYVSFVSINQSYSTGSVTGLYNVGGLVGQYQDFWGLTNVYSHANVTATGDYAGGLIGDIGDGFHGAPFIDAAYASGSVTSSGDNVGGLVGLDIANIYDSFAAGSVSAPSATHVGGFIGTYSAGDSNDNYFDATRTGQTQAAGSGSPAGITAVDTGGSPNSTYFFGSLTSHPMDSWDSSVWYAKAAGFPVMARSPHNVSSITTSPTATSIAVTWPAADNSDTVDITSYTLKYRLGDLSNGWTSVTVPAGATNSYTITRLVPNTPYSIAIVTNTSLGSSSGVGVIAQTKALPIIGQLGSESSGSVFSNSTGSTTTLAAELTASTALIGKSARSPHSISTPTIAGDTPAGLLSYVWLWVGALTVAGAVTISGTFLRFMRRPH